MHVKMTTVDSYSKIAESEEHKSKDKKTNYPNMIV